jgi:hypothetical protein
MPASQKIKTTTTAIPKLLARMSAQAHAQLLRLATCLNVRVNRCSLKAKRQMLLLFCLVFVSANLYLLVRSVTAKDKSILGISPIRVVPLQRQLASRLPIISQEEQAHVHHWKRYLDSMMRGGKRTRVADSFLKAHPHLLDTLRYLENFYAKRQINPHEK